MRPEDVDLRKIKVFQLIAELGSLRRAASRLNLTVSAVSFSLRRLEEDLGVGLVERTSNRLTLTAAGKTLADSIPDVFRNVESALDGLSAATAPRSQLSISTSSDLAWYFLPAIASFIRQNPTVDVNVLIYKSSDALPLVTKGELDIAIGRFPELEARRSGLPNLEWEPIVKCSFGLLCKPGHALLQHRRHPRLDEIAQHAIITLPHDFAARRIIASAFDRARLMPRKWVEVASCDLASAYVERDVGVGFIHTLCAQRQSPGLEFVSLEHLYGSITFAAIYRRTPRSSERPPTALLSMLEALTQ